ncbi:MAG: hypothetical protein WKF30_12925 [Pyrinomonadaceae bacterium]
MRTLRNLPASARKSAALVCALCLTLQVQFAGAQTNRITVQVDRPGAAIPVTLFGLFLKTLTSPPMAEFTPSW